MKFKEFKYEIINRAENAHACVSELDRAKKSNSYSELIKVITDNFNFSCEKNIIDVELLEKVGYETCNKNGLYFNQNVDSGYLICDSATVKAWGYATRLYKKSKSMDKKVLIVGSGGSGLMAAKIAELQAQNPDMEVVTIEEAKERGLSQTFEITAAPLLDERHYFKPPPTRVERRKQERMNKKKR